MRVAKGKLWVYTIKEKMGNHKNLYRIWYGSCCVFDRLSDNKDKVEFIDGGSCFRLPSGCKGIGWSDYAFSASQHGKRKSRRS